MIELTVDWQAIITLDDIPNRDADGDDTGASDPLRSEYGNLYGFCDDPRLGNRIVVIKNYTPFSDQEQLAKNDSSVFHAVPNLENPTRLPDALSGQELSINGALFTGTMVATNQNPFAQWALVTPDDNGNIPTVDLYFSDRPFVDRISDKLGVPRRGVE